LDVVSRECNDTWEKIHEQAEQQKDDVYQPIPVPIVVPLHA
jgi:hypothetical protein